jgi:4-amino-4-deoxy-L-arabinose transferase
MPTTGAGFAELTPAAARRAGLALLALYVLVYLAPLGVRPLVSPDEARYAEISREMIVSGDWVSPRFNGVRYFEKPIMGYWLNSLSFEVFGENAFALRLPSALAAGLTALLVFLLAARFATRASAYLAAAIYLTTLLVSGVGTFAVLDTFLALFLTGALASFYAAYAARAQERRLGWLAACGAFCAAAFLSKGFLALAIPVIVAGPFLMLRRDWRNLLRMPWVPILVATVLVAPWAVLVALREPDFWHYFFWIEHVQRFLGDNAQHLQPFWYFLVTGPFAALPWIAVLPAALIGLRRAGPAGAFLGYVIVWALMPFLFFSASKGKLLTYILPCFAPLSILLAIGLERYLGAGLRRAYSIGAALLGGLLLLALVLLAAAQRGAFDATLFADGETPRLFALLTCLAGALAAAILALAARAAVTRLVAIGAAGIALVLPLQLAPLPQWLLDSKAPAGFLAADIAVDADTILISDAPLFGAVAWSFGRDDVYLLSEGEISYGLAYPESRHRSLDEARLDALVAAHAGDVVMILRDSTAQRLPPALVGRAERRQRSDIVILRL